jgi:hypothetical protein
MRLGKENILKLNRLDGDSNARFIQLVEQVNSDLVIF